MNKFQALHVLSSFRGNVNGFRARARRPPLCVRSFAQEGPLLLFFTTRGLRIDPLGSARSGAQGLWSCIELMAMRALLVRMHLYSADWRSCFHFSWVPRWLVIATIRAMRGHVIEELIDYHRLLVDYHRASRLLIVSTSTCLHCAGAMI